MEHEPDTLEKLGIDRSETDEWNLREDIEQEGDQE